MHVRNRHSWIGAAMLLVSLESAPVHAEELWINMVAATSVEGAPPQSLFAKQPWTSAGKTFPSGKWQTEKDARFAKLHLYADREFALGGVKLKSCGQKFADDIFLFVNFDEKVQRLGKSNGVSEVEHRFGKSEPVKARSVTFNFGATQGVCIAAIELFDTDQQPYAIRVPRIVGGKAVASSTTKPVAAYDVMNLFDSRYENAWASDARSIGQRLDFTFDQPQTIAMLKIWNGYQRSDQHCYDNVRVKVLRVEGDGGYKATLAVQDVMGSQDLKLPAPYTGKTLRLTVAEAYNGKVYKDLVITELRFFDGKEWFTLDPFPRIRQIAAKNRADFAKAGLEGALGGLLAGSLQESDEAMEPGMWEMSASFKFRSDGSFYFEGQENHEARIRMSALGNYEIRAVSAKQMEVRLFGLYTISESTGAIEDCNGCGRDCNKTPERTTTRNETAGADIVTENRQQIFQDLLRFERAKAADGNPVVKVKSLGKKRFLILKDRRNAQNRELVLAVQ